METKKEERIDQIKSSTAWRNRAQKNEQPNSERELIRMEKVKFFSLAPLANEIKESI
jgi:hypothetical protein